MGFSGFVMNLNQIFVHNFSHITILLKKNEGFNLSFMKEVIIVQRNCL